MKNRSMELNEELSKHHKIKLAFKDSCCLLFWNVFCCSSIYRCMSTLACCRISPSRNSWCCPRNYKLDETLKKGFMKFKSDSDLISIIKS